MVLKCDFAAQLSAAQCYAASTSGEARVRGHGLSPCYLLELHVNRQLSQNNKFLKTEGV